MKRFIIFTGLLFLSTIGFSQESGLATSEESQLRYFGQCMVNLTSENEYVTLENSLKSNPNVYIVRLDRISQRVFILSNGMNSLSIEDFRSWFGDFGDRLSCIQVGVHQIDAVAQFPFTNCQN